MSIYKEAVIAGSLLLNMAFSSEEPQVNTPEAPNPGIRILIDDMNRLRAENDFNPVAENPALDAIAQMRSDDMALRHYFSHTPPDGRDYKKLLQERGINPLFSAEILAMNDYPDQEAIKVAFDTYLSSPAHKAIIEDPKYKQVGIGIKKSDDGSLYVTSILIDPQEELTMPGRAGLVE